MEITIFFFLNWTKGGNLMHLRYNFYCCGGGGRGGGIKWKCFHLLRQPKFKFQKMLNKKISIWFTKFSKRKKLWKWYMLITKLNFGKIKFSKILPDFLNIWTLKIVKLQVLVTENNDVSCSSDKWIRLVHFHTIPS